MARRDTQLKADQLQHFMRISSEGGTKTVERLGSMIRQRVPDPDGELRIADLGGGDGHVLDALLEAMPRAQGVLVDLAQEMVDANRPHPRKVAYRGDLANLDGALPEDLSFEVVLFNVVLHHCLAQGVGDTRELQQRILRQATRRLAPGGRILVLEQIHESPIVPDLASLLIYGLTRSKLLAPLTGRLGANTAGAGVLFASQARLRRLYVDAGLELVEEVLFRQDGTPWVALAVGCTNSCQKLYVLQPADAAPQV